MNKRGCIKVQVTNSLLRRKCRTGYLYGQEQCPSDITCHLRLLLISESLVVRTELDRGCCRMLNQARTPPCWDSTAAAMTSVVVEAWLLGIQSTMSTSLFCLYHFESFGIGDCVSLVLPSFHGIRRIAARRSTTASGHCWKKLFGMVGGNGDTPFV